jgi:hypothetical protein
MHFRLFSLQLMGAGLGLGVSIASYSHDGMRSARRFETAGKEARILRAGYWCFAPHRGLWTLTGNVNDLPENPRAYARLSPLKMLPAIFETACCIFFAG